MSERVTDEQLRDRVFYTDTEELLTLDLRALAQPAGEKGEG